MATAPQHVNICTAPRCDHPVLDAFVCRTCIDQLHRDLRELAGTDERPGLIDDLAVTMAKLDEDGQTAMREPGLDPHPLDQPIGETPLPFAPAAGELLRALHGELGTWVRHITESRGSDAAKGLADDPVELARWLDRHPDSICLDPAGGELVHAVGVLVIRARRVVDPAGETEYMGPCIHCDCSGPRCRGGHPDPADLYVPRWAVQVRCPVCKATWRVEERREWLLTQAREQLLTAVEASRALPGLLDELMPGRPLTSAMIRNYGNRGRLTQHRPHPNDWDVDDHGEPIEPAPRYQVGEMLDLVIKLRGEEVDRVRRRAAC